ncbi:MAG: hypothetical protein JWN10_858 [Solirubrobacterales bacterium]|nr:hypothetical protein [Solirubrobacterales bacterium]
MRLQGGPLDGRRGASEIVMALGGYRLKFVSESDLHDAVAWVLDNAFIEFEREVILGPRDRIDLLAGTVGIEIKVGGSSAALEQQLARYAMSDRVSALVVVTSCSRHASIARSFNDKPVSLVPTCRP